ncbi:hypothetical protein [Streptomyces sp. NPDC007206]|uniref:hypothetical protein n=1 Tax=Streptomyces sp. NPDC007206 TaxID=3154317 RepID=UPI0033CE2091
MVDVAESAAGTDTDRCYFTVAFQIPHDQVVQAAGVVSTAAGPARLGYVRLIGRRVLAHLLPPRRQPVSTRKVKSPTSSYSDGRYDGRPDTSRTVTSLDFTVLESANLQPALPTASRHDRHAAPAHRRRHCIRALLQEDSARPWRPRDSAARFGDVTLDRTDD